MTAHVDNNHELVKNFADWMASTRGLVKVLARQDPDISERLLRIERVAFRDSLDLVLEHISR